MYWQLSKSLALFVFYLCFIFFRFLSLTDLSSVRDVHAPAARSTQLSGPLTHTHVLRNHSFSGNWKRGCNCDEMALLCGCERYVITRVPVVNEAVFRLVSSGSFRTCWAFVIRRLWFGSGACTMMVVTGLVWSWQNQTSLALLVPWSWSSTFFVNSGFDPEFVEVCTWMCDISG